MSAISWTKQSTYMSLYGAVMYQSHVNRIWYNVCRHAVDMLNVNSSDIVADIGAGTGAATRYLLNNNPKKVYAIDRSIHMLSLLAIDLGSHDNLIIANSNEEEMADILRPAEVTKSISVGVYSTVPDKFKFLRNIYSQLVNSSFLFTLEDLSEGRVGDMTMQEWHMQKDRVFSKYFGSVETFNYLAAPKKQKSRVSRTIEEAGGTLLDLVEHKMQGKMKTEIKSELSFFSKVFNESDELKRLTDFNAELLERYGEYPVFYGYALMFLTKPITSF
ncbi:MAG: class I SAM-dependent methyltransferase [Candidatus Woesearchaeota archaeon]|nr:class I SAM-dependent methyltransferase [Candidatus Woesearchaeota archaeon]